jgi:hypothetical protein
MKTLTITLSLACVLLPFAVLLTILVNQAIADYRAWKASGRAVDAGDLGFARLCYVTLMVAIWLGGMR